MSADPDRRRSAVPTTGRLPRLRTSTVLCNPRMSSDGDQCVTLRSRRSHCADADHGVLIGTRLRVILAAAQVRVRRPHRRPRPNWYRSANDSTHTATHRPRSVRKPGRKLASIKGFRRPRRGRMSIERRTFLRGSAAVAGGMLAGGPFQGFVAREAVAAPQGSAPFRALRAIPDQRDGKVRLHLPEGFKYRSFHDTEFPVVLDDGTNLPGRHDGMGAFQRRNGNIVLVRNHEVNNPGAPFGPGTPYDTMAQSGTTTVEVTRFGQVVNAYTSLNGTMMNCSGGVMPWGSWITCEETVNGPDVGPDFTGALEHRADQTARFRLRGSGPRPVRPRADHPRRPVRPRGRLVRPARRVPLPDRGQLRVPIRVLPLPPAPEPDEARADRGRRPAADARGQRPSEPEPRGRAATTGDVRRDVGRHRRPGAEVPLHTGAARADDERPGTRVRR